jgi:hypothetical protein
MGRRMVAPRWLYVEIELKRRRKEDMGEEGPER